MPVSPLTQDAVAIWTAGVDAVRPDRLIPDVVRSNGEVLTVCDETFRLTDWNRVIVVGAGKAGGSMAAALEAALHGTPWSERLTGWVNVPADCVVQLPHIQLHAARPAGVNEPTAEGVAGTRKILDLVASCAPRDLCLVLLSGGGSALLPAPIDGVSLAEKQQVTRDLMHRGATIAELNTVRKQLSAVKGGGLARAGRRAGRLISLVISDVVGDPLDIIASGPTVADVSTPAEACRLLRRFYPDETDIPAGVRTVLARAESDESRRANFPNVTNHVIGSNSVALGAASDRATSLGYDVVSLGSGNEGTADREGVRLAERLLELRTRFEKVCLLSGGEPTVILSPSERPRKGGRNQQLALNALCRLSHENLTGLALLSGGTDGEDGPTDAAGAFVDAAVLAEVRRLGLTPESFRDGQNAYPFFEQTGGLLKTGPTGTNVMDLRVGLVAKSEK